MGIGEMIGKFVLAVIFGIFLASALPSSFAEPTIATVQWFEESYPATGAGVVQVFDPDKNLNLQAIDNFDVDVWSDADAGGIDLTVTETGASTGTFQGTVFFTLTEESSGHRLRVSEGDTITAEYMDSTLPPPFNPTDELDITGTTVIEGTVCDPCPPPVPPLQEQIDVLAFVLGALIDGLGNTFTTIGLALTSLQGQADDHETRITDLENTPNTSLTRTTFSQSGGELIMMPSENSFCALTREFGIPPSGVPACEIVERTGNWVLKANIADTCTASCLQWTQTIGEPIVTKNVLRFHAGNNQEVNVNPLFFIEGDTEGSPLNGLLDFRRGATLVGVDGVITELRYEMGPVEGLIEITVSLWKNNAVIATCLVTTGPTTTSCVTTLNEPVSAGDLIAVSDVSQGVNVAVDFRHASVVVSDPGVGIIAPG